jgi:hypothetical protein
LRASDDCRRRGSQKVSAVNSLWHHGLNSPLGTRGTYVQGGIKIGFVTDYFCKVILKACAPISGVILNINTVPSRKKGDNIADIAAIAAHAP